MNPTIVSSFETPCHHHFYFLYLHGIKKKLSVMHNVFLVLKRLCWKGWRSNIKYILYKISLIFITLLKDSVWWGKWNIDWNVLLLMTMSCMLIFTTFEFLHMLCINLCYTRQASMHAKPRLLWFMYLCIGLFK